MGARNRLEPVDVVELVGDLVPEQPAGAARANGPRLNVLRVAPHQIAEGALVGDLLGAGDDTDLVDGADLRAQAAVHAEDGPVDDGGQHEEVEDLAAGLPDRGVAVFLLALFVEPVHLCYLARFVVATDEDYPIGVSMGPC